MTTRLLAAGMGLVLVLAACSGGDGSGEGVATLEAVDSATTEAVVEDDVGAVDSEQAMLDFAACMRDNGVEMEDPTVDADGNIQFGGMRGIAGDDQDFETVRAAMDVCRQSIEGLVLGRGGDFDLTDLEDTMLEYAACMRDNGYDMPDPDFTAFGPGRGDGDGEPNEGAGPFSSIDPTDPDFIAAQEACQDLLSGFGPGGGGRGGGLGSVSDDG